MNTQPWKPNPPAEWTGQARADYYAGYSDSYHGLEDATLPGGLQGVDQGVLIPEEIAARQMQAPHVSGRSLACPPKPEGHRGEGVA